MKKYVFYLKIFYIFEKACFRNVRINKVSLIHRLLHSTSAYQKHTDHLPCSTHYVKMGIKKSKQENHTKTSQETQNTNNNIQRLEEYSHMMNTENSETLNPTCQLGIWA